jgi:hypothetical protein
VERSETPGTSFTDTKPRNGATDRWCSGGCRHPQSKPVKSLAARFPRTAWAQLYAVSKRGLSPRGTFATKKPCPIYHVRDNWETDEDLAPTIQKRFEQWRANQS